VRDLFDVDGVVAGDSRRGVRTGLLLEEVLDGRDAEAEELDRTSEIRRVQTDAGKGRGDDIDDMWRFEAGVGRLAGNDAIQGHAGPLIDDVAGEGRLVLW
jgi:hypothetical protein